jgi:hypothetical protein
VAIVLGPNRYGKAETRLVRVFRDDDTHRIADLNVSVALSGDLAATHLTGDNAGVLPTDTMKNTVYAFAKEYGVGEPEEFGLLLAMHFVAGQPQVRAAKVAIESFEWERLGPHSFRRKGDYVRTAAVTVTVDQQQVVSGLRDMVLLNSTASEFRHQGRLVRVVPRHARGADQGVCEYLQLFTAADVVLDGVAGARDPARDRRDPARAAQQAPLSGRPVAVRSRQRQRGIHRR